MSSACTSTELQLVIARFVLHEADVHLAIHDLPRNFGERAAVDADLDVGKFAEVLTQRRGQQIHGRGFVRRNRQRPRLERFQRAQLRASSRRARGPSVGAYSTSSFASFGQRQVVHVAREERRADFVFKFLDAL